MPDRPGAMTSRDVAALAGVSQSTVSYVMSGKRSVSEDTRQRVFAAMEELKYQPHAGARALRARRTQVIGLDVVLSVDEDGGDTVPYIEAVVREMRDRDYDVVLLAQSEGPAGLRRLAGRHICDGFILMDIGLDDARIPVMAELRMPAVTIGRAGSAGGLDAVDSDSYAAGALLAKELVDSGHRHVALLERAKTLVPGRFLYIEEFVRGARETAEAAGLSFATVSTERDGFDGIHDIREQLLAHRDDRLGLIARQPRAVELVTQLLRSEGLVPGVDVSLVAQVTDAVAERYDRPVSNASQDPQAQVARAVEMLFRRIEGGTGPASLALVPPAPLHRRATTCVYP